MEEHLSNKALTSMIDESALLSTENRMKLKNALPSMDATKRQTMRNLLQNETDILLETTKNIIQTEVVEKKNPAVISLLDNFFRGTAKSLRTAREDTDRTTEDKELLKLEQKFS